MNKFILSSLCKGGRYFLINSSPLGMFDYQQLKTCFFFVCSLLALYFILLLALFQLVQIAFVLTKVCKNFTCIHLNEAQPFHKCHRSLLTKGQLYEVMTLFLGQHVYGIIYVRLQLFLVKTSTVQLLPPR